MKSHPLSWSNATLLGAFNRVGLVVYKGCDSATPATSASVPFASKQRTTLFAVSVKNSAPPGPTVMELGWFRFAATACAGEERQAGVIDGGPRE